jgi:hypothetical protein
MSSQILITMDDLETAVRLNASPDINRIAFDSPSQPGGPGIFI